MEVAGYVSACRVLSWTFTDMNYCHLSHALTCEHGCPADVADMRAGAVATIILRQGSCADITSG